MSQKPDSGASQRGALAHEHYEASFNHWIGGKAREFRELTADLIGVIPGESVLDLGCGTGALARILARRVGPTGCVAGVDLSMELIEGAVDKAKDDDVSIDYRVGSVEKLPFADSTVDVVVSSLVLHHLAPDVVRRTIGEIHRVLKPGARLFVIDFASLAQAGRPHDQASSAANGHWHDHGGSHPHPEKSASHGLLHDHRPTLATALREAGFTDVESVGVAFGQRLEVTRGRSPL